jgi:hypothetical protein
MEREHTAQRLSIERSASHHEQILKIAADMDSSMSWQDRVKEATKLYKEITEMMSKQT